MFLCRILLFVSLAVPTMLLIFLALWHLVENSHNTDAQQYYGRSSNGSTTQAQRETLNSSPQKVLLDVYYETNCPDSMRFVTRQLYPLYQDMKDAIDIHLIPFGKASEEYSPISKLYSFKCHHGPAECYGNTVQICAITLYPEPKDFLSFINCMESSYPRPSDSGEKCARRTSLDWPKISKCANGNEGNRLLHTMAEETKALNPPLNFVPWINVNKRHTQDIQRRSLRDLKGVVCETYQAHHPKCSV